MTDQVEAPEATEASEKVAEQSATPPKPAPRSRDNQIRLIEAILFASKAPIEEKNLAARLGVDAGIKELMADLAARYDGRGVVLVERNGKWAFRTADDLSDYLTVERQESRKLSRAAMETLAIIAYHQPVTRAEIEEVRGVALSKGTLDALFEAGWIHPRGRKKTPGRPVLWRTTDAFLDHFGLENLTDLPGVEELKAAGLLDTRPALAAYGARAHDDGTLVDIEDDEDDGQLTLIEDTFGEEDEA